MLNIFTNKKENQIITSLTSALIKRIGIKENEVEDYNNPEMFGLSSTVKAVNISGGSQMVVEFIEVSRKSVCGYFKHKTNLSLNIKGSEAQLTYMGNEFNISDIENVEAFSQLADFIYTNTVKNSSITVSISDIENQIGSAEAQAILGKAMLNLLRSSDEITKENIASYIDKVSSTSPHAPGAIAELIVSK